MGVGQSRTESDVITLRRERIERKRILRAVYHDWYRAIGDALPTRGKPVLEIGSGPGFLDTVVPGVVRSDIVYHRIQHAVLDATALPFTDNAFLGVVGVNVFHHLPDPGQFLREVTRCLAVSGRLVLIEPWVNIWSSFWIRLLHTEGFDPRAGWKSVMAGRPLDEANNALAWIVFRRDHATFSDEFSSLRLVSISPMMPLLYLLSGGISRDGEAPVWLHHLARWFERNLPLVSRSCGMFSLVVVERTDPSPEPAIRVAAAQGRPTSP